MASNDFIFELNTSQRPIIKVIGVGGGGSNAVNYMFNQGIKDVEFIICNTDAQALRTSPVPTKLQLGANLTEGLGAGANPEKGRDAALESKDAIRDLLSQNTKMIFITAGMGGGTGTGAAPVIAQIAQSLDILTVAIVTAPFSAEGKKKKEQAYMGIEQLKEYCDTVLVILNDKLIDIYGELPKSKAFAQADGVLSNAAKSIAEIITKPGYINTDFEDVKKVMKSAGQAVMGSAQARGESRAKKVIEDALSSPLLNSRDIRGARKILLTMFYSMEKEMTLGEQDIITNYIREKTDIEPDEVIMGDVIDDSLGEDLRITVIATGFEASEESESEKKRYLHLESDQAIVTAQAKEPVKSQEEIPVQKNFYDINGFEIIDLEKDEPKVETDFQDRKLKERAERLKKLSQLSADEVEKRDKIPAYMRKNVKLMDIPHSSENQISRFKLDDDNSILGNNKFLHDNVD